MFVDFLYELRNRKVPVGAQEAVALAAALSHGLHDSSLDGFYYVARSILVHDERHLDDFDVAFGAHYRGIPAAAKEVAEELLSWLRDPIKMRELSDAEREAIEGLDLEEVLKKLEERLKEQRERHDGGNRWVGTGGTSPFGSGGANPNGVSLGGGGGRGGALIAADVRKYKPYRSDVILDTRQIEVALRKLRVFAHEGAEEELDIEGTIAATAKNAGELEIVLSPPRRSNTRVILMMDVGGSMDPHTYVLSQLFSAAKRASHFKELRTYYFHNCIYGRVYKTESFLEPVTIRDLIAECNATYKLVLVGDALMAPYELLGSSGFVGEEGRIAGIDWLRMLKDHFHRGVWLNPEAWRNYRGTTIDPIAQIFPMFDLTLEGLGEAVTELLRGGRR
ncbi:MAG: VWA domain-containing protein [Myxococcales bacterium]|nr:VWA domain-containing protein [Myxococcales bacterium]